MARYVIHVKDRTKTDPILEEEHIVSVHCGVDASYFIIESNEDWETLRKKYEGSAIVGVEGEPDATGTNSLLP